MKNTFIAFLFLIGFGGYAQKDPYQDPDSLSTLQLHMGIGFYLPQDNMAYYYSGADNGRFNQVLNYSEPEIREALGGFPFTLREAPTDFIYRNQISFMLSGTYAINRHWRILLMLQQAKLEATGTFTLNVERTNTQNPNEDYIEQFTMYGKERRSHFQLGAMYRISLNNVFYVNFGGGLDINTVEVQENKMIIGSREFSLPAATINQPQAGQITTSGIGFFAFPELAYENEKGLGIFTRITYINTKISLNRIMEDKTSIVIPALGFSWNF